MRFPLRMCGVVDVLDGDVVLLIGRAFHHTPASVGIAFFGPFIDGLGSDVGLRTPLAEMGGDAVQRGLEFDGEQENAVRENGAEREYEEEELERLIVFETNVRV